MEDTNRTEITDGRDDLNPDEPEVWVMPEDEPASTEDLPKEPYAYGDSHEKIHPDAEIELEPVRQPRLIGGLNTPRKSRVPRLAKKQERSYNRPFTPEQRLLLLDTWIKSGLPAKDFGSLVGVSSHSLYKWKRSFKKFGPEGLLDERKGPQQGSKMSEPAKRAILMIKEENPEYGINRISDMLYRGLSISVSPQAISSFLKSQGYELEQVRTKPHPDKVRRFERAKPSELWQTDLFTFMMKRQNRRVHMVAFMDDHSRFIVGYGLHASASAALVIECMGTAIASFGAPEEVLTDNGSQYITWRGKSRFVKECEKRGIRQIVASPRRPQTLGKVERFWGTLWRECIEKAIFIDMGDARKRIGLFIDYYNFQRPHQGIGGLVPADRFFHAAPEVLKTLKGSVEANSLKFAREGVPKTPFYMTGNVGGKKFSVHAEGEHVIMLGEDGARKEVDLVPPANGELPVRELPDPVSADGSIESPGLYDKVEPAPGTSPLDEGIAKIAESMQQTIQDVEGGTHEEQ